MAKQRLTDKAQRLLTFLMALRFARVRRSVRRIGYDDAQIKRGWDLLRAASGERLDMVVEGPTSMDDGVLAALDEWENRWYPVIDATLKYNFPDVHAVVFNGLSQTQGPDLVISVGKLLDRVEAAPDGAKTLLAQRRVTSEVLAEARAFIGTIEDASDHGDIDPEESEGQRRALADAEDAMWRHYLEWSTIVRAQLTNASYLRLMGFGTTTKKRGSKAPTTTEDVTPVAPPAIVPTTPTADA